MEAHALTPRMAESSLDFPFMVMLVSGGHCLLAIARVGLISSYLGNWFPKLVAIEVY